MILCLEAWSAVITDYWGLFCPHLKRKHMLYYKLFISCVFLYMWFIPHQLHHHLHLSICWQHSFIQRGRRGSLRREVARVLGVGWRGVCAPLRSSFGDRRADTWNSWCAPKTNYRGPWPPAWLHVRPESVIVSAHRWALTRGRHRDGQMGDTAGSGYRSVLPRPGCIGGNWNFRCRRGSYLMFYLHHTVHWEQGSWPEPLYRFCGGVSGWDSVACNQNSKLFRYTRVFLFLKINKYMN